MRAAAREQRDASDRDLAKLTGELGAIPEDIEERLQRLEERSRRSRLGDSAPRSAGRGDALTQSLEQSATVLAAAEKAAAAATNALSEIPTSTR